MARTTAPLLSFDARGQLAKTMVYSSWKGIPYVRRHVIPANPRTTAQQTVRKTFALLREMWKLGPAQLYDTWNSFAQGRPFTGMNKLVGENVRVLNGETDMNNFIGSPGSKGGLPPVSFVAVAGGAPGEIDVTFVNATPPSGWTLVSNVTLWFKDQPPDGIFVGPIAAHTEAGPGLTYTITGLDTGDDYQVVGWTIWTKPDGTTAYSVGITDQAAAA